MKAVLPLSALALLTLAAVPLAGAIHYHTSCAQASGSTGADQATANGEQVLVGFDWFAPSAIVVPAGESVTWTWDPVQAYCHSVTAPGFGTHEVSGNAANGRLVPAGSPPSLLGFFPNPANMPGAPLSYTHVFSTPGTYTYICQEHFLIGMAGVVEVV